ncbi:MAG: hypothetical protein CME70_05040 [Halobacteriovorax sp.]|nr:hypothetical protein [Halobacteriovorax sp.]|tara:strand:+ start:46633 stop:47205 length:573 start_codon:yes stop_codon:yes gene_type:complete
MKKIIFALSGLAIFFTLAITTISLGSGTYTPTQTKIQFKVSQRLANDFNELSSIFGVTKTYQHKVDKKTVLSYQIDEEEYNLEPRSVKPKQYVKAFKKVKTDLLSVNGATNLKITSFKLDRKKGGYYKYKISGQYKRYNGETVNFYEVNYFQNNVSVNIQVVTMDQGNATITRGEAFSLFDEVLETLDEV